MADLPTHFFKFIPPGFKFNISIPKSFLTNLNGSSRCKKAILRRGHHKWEVHVNISDGGVFDDGWWEFVTDNGVEALDFIVFKHQGNMVFECFVFDQSTCERQYPYPNPNIFEDVKESLTESSDSLHIHIHKRSKKMVNKAVKMTENNNYRSDGDHCFVIIMTSYCIKAGRLHVPMKFANSNGLFSKRGSTEIVIVDEEQTCWIAKLKNRTTEIYLTGWRKVVLANQLNVGDVCKFELVKAGKVPRYNFYFIGKKKPTKDHVQVTKKTSSTMPKAARSSSTRYFISTLKAYCIRSSCLYFPNKFARKNGLFHKEEMILKNVDGSWWSVEIKKFKNGFVTYDKDGKHFVLQIGSRKGNISNWSSSAMVKNLLHAFTLYDHVNI